MKIGYGTSGGGPASTYAIQEETADGFDAVETGFHREHDEQGRHTTLTALDVAGDGEIAGTLTLGEGLIAEGEYGEELTANTNDYARPDGRTIDQLVIRLQSTGAINLTGIVPPSTENHVRLLVNGGNNTITLKHNVTSAAANRFSLPLSADYALGSGQIALALYDRSSNIWRVLIPGGASVVNRIQQGTLTFANGGSDVPTATITAVDTAKAYVINNGWKASAAMAGGIGVVLTNATTVTGNRDGSDNGISITGYFTVVELK